jgi:hypothetical protein
VPEQDIAVASVFTTQSVTAVLEKIRDQIELGTPGWADFALGPGGARAVYPLNALTDLQSVRQTGTASFSTTTTPFLALSLTAPGAVGAVAFAKYASPVYLTAERHIPVEATRLGTPEVQDTEEIFFNLILPAVPPPASGWPVAIYDQGSGENKEGGPFLVAATMAAHGIATIAINAVGRGLGALSTLRLLRGTGAPISLPAGGRGIDTNGDGQITSTEGSFALAPRGIIRDRDARLQTAADLMQLVRVIQVGVDVDGDGVGDLDPSRIYYFGYSFGGNYGAVFLSAEQNVRAGVLMAPGGPSLESNRLSPPNRASLGALLAARVPSLINLSGTSFDENLPLRDQPPVVNTVPGAMEIQELLDNFEWVGQAGDVVPYGAHLRRAPLEGVEPKSVIVPRGETAPSPTRRRRRSSALASWPTARLTTASISSARATRRPLRRSTMLTRSYTRFLPLRPLPPEVRAAANAVALAVHEQIAVFFASDGVDVIDPDGPGVLFETPIVPPLPEDAVFFP